MKIIAVLLLFVLAVYAAKHVQQAQSRTAINGAYIVVLKQGSGEALRDAHIEKLQAAMTAANDASEVTYRYSIGSFVAFAAKLSDDMLNIELAHPDVDYIEADQVMRIIAAPVVQPKATWGLTRIPVRGGWDVTKDTSYTYNSTAGEGVRVYVVDTGIHFTHNDFGGRAVAGYSAFSDSGADQNGHGTHCAGTIGGTTYGVAKKVTLVAVKVLNAQGSGTNSGVLAGINWVTSDHAKLKTPAVASMSLGGSYSAALNNAVENSIKGGVVYSIAAGNSNADACNFSPASAPSAISVGAVQQPAQKASYSNWGTCVDLFAPGSSITSDWWTSNTATNTISGTSMACPHVSGVLALHLADNTDWTPAQLKTWVIATSTPNIVTGILSTQPGTPNQLLYSPFSG